MRNPLKIFWIVLGFLCLGFGTIGIVLPILPTVPFYMATLFCFAKSSERLHSWFIGTSYPRRNKMNKVEKKRQKEQYVVEEMIRLYCRKNHGKEGHA